MSLEETIERANMEIDERVATCRKEYAKIAAKTTLVGKGLYLYCKDWMLWEVRFDDYLNLVPLEKALEMIEDDRRRAIARRTYDYRRRVTHKDNQRFCYVGSGGSNKNEIRVPSLKRSNRTWRNFYELFPYLKGLETYHGIKLKRI